MKIQLLPTALILPLALFAPSRQYAQSAPAPAHEHHADAAPHPHSAPAGAAAFRGKGDGVATCPASGDPIDPNLSAVINGRKVFFCCEDCVAAVKKNPERYLKADSGVAPDAPAAGKAAAAAPEQACADKPADSASLVPPADGCAAPEPEKKAAPVAAPPPAAN